MKKIFDTDKRIKLGIWGLGRGANFVKSAAFLNIDVVAGCDIHPEIRERFQQIAPKARCTADEKEFLSCDMDAVLVATYLPDHARHAIRVLESGRHVMSEVTAFQTPADAVRLVEAVEKSGKVYNLLENYPFTRENMYLQKLWSEGFFGDFLYGEFEYLHEYRALSYGYNTSPKVLPVEPGWAVHRWRSVLNYHFYCTHSLGPAMYITGLRPESISAVRDEVSMTGYLDGGRHATAAPSIIKMSNGGLLRNLMGSTTNDYHAGLRLWGTRAAAEKLHGLKLRVGGSGSGGMFLSVDPKWNELGELAQETGHGGGDFWELYFFAREILTGEPAPWNIYAACDVTMAGLMAVRSEQRNGELVKIPDLRKAEDRELCRSDRGDLPTLDTSDIFPAGHETELAGQFTRVMTELYPHGNGGLVLFNNVMDGIRIYNDLLDADSKLQVRNAVGRLICELPALAENCRTAQKIQAAYPDSNPGRTIARVLAEQQLEKILNYEQTIRELEDWQNHLI